MESPLLSMAIRGAAIRGAAIRGAAIRGAAIRGASLQGYLCGVSRTALLGLAPMPLLKARRSDPCF
jgi:uncharacterized protein YjbI with pentapeptide repeats